MANARQQRKRKSISIRVKEWTRKLARLASLASVLVSASLLSGCHQRQQLGDPNAYLSDQFLRIDEPRLADQSCENLDGILAETPPTISNYEDLEPWELTVEQTVEIALQNSKVLQKLGGRVVTAPGGIRTVYDPAIQASNPLSGTEAALSAFDAQIASSYYLAENTQPGFTFPGFPFTSIQQQTKNYRLDFSKQTASGTRFAVRNISARQENSSTFANTINTLLQAEVRQPLMRGFGADVNRIAGPNAQPGIYNGVLLARINSDISVADFEAGIRDLVRDVERSYWELYYAYRDLDSKKQAREAARKVWENRKARLDNGLGRPDEEAQARQQYFNFQTQVQNALTGLPNSNLGVFGAERELRRLMGVPTSDGKLIRPASEPLMAQVKLDWENTQIKTLDRRVELRRQKWIVRQRELELLAARDLNRFQLDFVGQYGSRGIVPIAPDNKDLFGIFAAAGYKENWNIGLELSGPIGKRLYHAAARNAELLLARDQAILREQQRQVLHDLNAAYTEVDRAFAAIKSNYNNLIAVEEELGPKIRRVEAGEEDVFFLLDAQQRATIIRTAFHRAIVDYNISLLTYAYTAGDLLDRYQISLAEGPWAPEAYMHPNVGLRDFVTVPGDYRRSESQPVSFGPHQQQTEFNDPAYQENATSIEPVPLQEDRQPAAVNPILPNP